MDRIYTDNNVYILGAGFSADAGLPVVAEFMNRLRDTVKHTEDSGNAKGLKALERVVSFRKQASSAAYRLNIDIENIEQLFSLAAATDQTLEEDLKESIALTLDYCSSTAPLVEIALGFSTPGPTELISWMREQQLILDDSRNNVGAYNYYLLQMLGYLQKSYEHSKNAIISFNYDLVAEKALSKLKIPFHYGLKRATIHSDAGVTKDEGIPLLKLHGSLNWGYTGRHGEKLNVYGSSQEISALGHKRLLIPPTWQKVFVGHMAQIWNEARTAITKATRIIVIGFSMPETDIHFKYLLGAGLKENISLRKVIFVNPTPLAEFEPKLQAMFQPSFLTKAALDYYPRDLSSFLRNPEFIRSIGRAYF